MAVTMFPMQRVGRSFEVKTDELKPEGQPEDMAEKAQKFTAELIQMWRTNDAPKGKFKVIVAFEREAN